MFADIEHALEKMDQTFQPIRMEMKENKKRGYTAVRVHYTVQLKKMLNGHVSDISPKHTFKISVQFLTNLYSVRGNFKQSLMP